LKTNSYQAQSRNKLITEAFYLTKDIEKHGSGYRRIREYIKEYPSMYFHFEENSGGYLAKIGYKEQKILKEAITKKNGGINGGIKEELQNLLLIIRSNQGLNANQIKDITNIPQRTLERWLNELKSLKLIEFKGSKKTGGYYAV